jgi:FkbM family methyltransferase
VYAIELMMQFISYAQNYEDVMLWRALRHVDKGFYVDVGAGDPKEMSVTCAFYERGWSGVNIEPLNRYFDRLRQARPRDINLKVAVGKEPGVRTLPGFPGLGLSSVGPETGPGHQDAGFVAEKAVVPVLTLTKILEDCGTPTIHFLRIDAEGAEGEVLEGLDLDRVRPWIVLVQANGTNSTSSRDNWKHLMTGHSYRLAYFDGLNCFYVADEVCKLKEQLTAPPNAFDDFVRWSEWQAISHAEDLEKLLRAEQTKVIKMSAAFQAEKNRAAELRNAFAQLKAENDNLCQALAIEQAQTTNLQAQTNDLRNALAAEQAQTSNLQNTLAAEQAQIVNLQNTLAAEQAQIVNLQNAWLARLDYLSSRIENVHAQLAFPWADRAAGRIVKGLQETGNRLTGGGIRAAVRRLLKAWLCSYLAFAGRHPRLAVIPRTMLRPFPRLTAGLYHIAVTPTPVAGTKVTGGGPGNG